MKLSDYLSKNLDHVVMISLAVDESDAFQYNYWNWVSSQKQLFLLKNDFTIGHIVHDGSIDQNNDGSINYKSDYYPKNITINFYFGGATP